MAERFKPILKPDFAPLYEKLKTLPEIEAGAIVAGDRLICARD